MNTAQSPLYLLCLQDQYFVGYVIVLSPGTTFLFFWNSFAVRVCQVAVSFLELLGKFLHEVMLFGDSYFVFLQTLIL